jgi:hypothetical protein
MDIDAWLVAVQADADRRGLPELKPMLATLAAATRLLRAGLTAVDSNDGHRDDR